MVPAFTLRCILPQLWILGHCGFHFQSSNNGLKQSVMEVGGKGWRVVQKMGIVRTLILPIAS